MGGGRVLILQIYYDQVTVSHRPEPNAIFSIYVNDRDNTSVAPHTVFFFSKFAFCDILWHPNFNLGEEITRRGMFSVPVFRGQASCSCRALHLWSAVRRSRRDQGEGSARVPGCPQPLGAHRGALCGLRLGEPRPGNEGRVRARSPPPPGEGSGRAAAAPEASALGAGPADAA